MTQSPPPYTSVFPRVKPERVKQVIGHPATKPAKALFALSGELSGRQKQLLNDLQPCVIYATNLALRKASFKRDEIGAAFAVLMGSLSLPQ